MDLCRKQVLWDKCVDGQTRSKMGGVTSDTIYEWPVIHYSTQDVARSCGYSPVLSAYFVPHSSPRQARVTDEKPKMKRFCIERFRNENSSCWSICCTIRSFQAEFEPKSRILQKFAQGIKMDEELRVWISIKLEASSVLIVDLLFDIRNIWRIPSNANAKYKYHKNWNHSMQICTTTTSEV